MTTNSNVSTNSTENTATVSTEKKAKRIYRTVAEIKANIAEENDAEKLVQLAKELAATQRHEDKVTAREGEKLLKAEKREKNKRTLKALKRLFESLEIGAVLTVVVTNDSGEELFANTVTVPEPKKKVESTETK